MTNSTESVSCDSDIPAKLIAFDVQSRHKDTGTLYLLSGIAYRTSSQTVLVHVRGYKSTQPVWKCPSDSIM